MPITKYTGANIKKLKKDELISHVIELYGFIDLFNNEEPKDREIAKLKEDYTQMKDLTDRHQKEIHRLKDEKNTLKEELKDATEEGHYNGREEAQEEYEKVAYEICESRLHANNPILMAESAKLLHKKNNKLNEELIKLKNDNEIVKMMFIDEFVRDEIEKTIDEGIDQYTFNIGTGYYKEHKLKYVKDIIMPHLTTYHNGDSQCSSYQNGKFYYKMDCMMPYDIETDNDGTYTFNRIDDDY